MIVIETALLLAGIIAVTLGAYLLFLTIVSLFYRSPGLDDTAPSTRFAVLVPAHNEENVIPALFKSLGRMDYPNDLFDVFVVADNCVDSTAEVARSHGAKVFEREDNILWGKPHALRWLLGKIPDEQPYDAYAFVDADVEVSPNFLDVIDRELRNDNCVVQVHYAVSNPTGASASAIRFIAFQLINYVRPLGKRVLGLSSGLYGTGMAFKRETLEAHGWDSFTLAEDVEYTLKLNEQGIRVAFAPEAKVVSAMPENLKDSASQNLRWEKGRLLMAWRFGFRFLVRGVYQRNPMLLAAGMDQLIPPLSITFAATLLLLLLSLATFDATLIGLAAAANIALFGHILIGMISSKVPLRTYKALAFAPWFIVWKMLIYLQALKPGEVRWTRTQRHQQK